MKLIIKNYDRGVCLNKNLYLPYFNDDFNFNNDLF
jgi:hypothetical protein